MNGSSQRIPGYTTVHKSDVAIGRANASDDHLDVRLIHKAVRRPTRTAATTPGSATSSSAANTGSLKRKRCT
jgi:hypothetical protein